MPFVLLARAVLTLVALAVPDRPVKEILPARWLTSPACRGFPPD
jgi:hypothetical protein